MFRKFLRDLQWVHRFYGTLFLSEDQIADYIRDDISYIEELAASGVFGDKKKTAGYNAFEVISWHLGLDSSSRLALKSVYVDGANEKMAQRETEKGRPRKSLEEKVKAVRPRKDGLYSVRVYTRDGTKTVYDHDKSVLLLKAKQVELEDQQRQFMEEVSKLSPDGLQRMNVQLSSLKERYDKTTSSQAVTKAEKSGVPLRVAPTFDEAFKMWMRSRRDEGVVKPQTLDTYASHYKNIMKPRASFINKPVDKITNKEINDFLKEEIKMSVSNSSFDKDKAILTGVLEHMLILRSEEEGWEHLSLKVDFKVIEASTYRLRKKIPKAKNKELAMSDETMQKFNIIIDNLIATKRNGRIRYMVIKLNFYLGLRRGELAALTVDDIDLENRVVHVRGGEISYREVDKNLEYTGVRKVMDSTTKSDHGVRDIPLCDEAYEIVKRILDYREKRRYRDKHIMYDKKESKGYISNLADACNNVNKRRCDDLPYFHIHLQRKTFATRLRREGLSDTDITMLMGHSSIATTQRYYFLSEDGRLEEQRKGIEAAINFNQL